MRTVLKLRRLSLFCSAILSLLSSVPARGDFGADTASASAGRETRIKEFLEEELEFDQFVFPPGPLPGVRWKRPATVARLLGEFPLTVEYYDRTFAVVSRAGKPGRYGAVVRGITPDGFRIVRFVTLYCCEADLDDYSPQVPVIIEPLAGFGVSPVQWQSYRKNVRTYSFGSLLTFPRRNPDAAVFLAGLSELDPNGGRMETPRLRDRQWWIDFKARESNVSARLPDTPPRTSRAHAFQKAAVGARSDEAGADTRPTAVLRDAGRTNITPYRAEHIRRLQSICSAWADSSHVPFVALVAHTGHVVFHETFGKGKHSKLMSRSTPTWMASITKLLTGVLVMQFVDQGLVDLDAPLDRYLPELAATTPCLLTLRHLLTHTGGLSWAGDWASDWNPSMENQVAHALPYIAPGRKFTYHRSGYALTGKVLERISGRTVPYLFDRMILSPLGMKHSFADNTYGGLYATAMDLARFGQMLLNRGQYGDHQFLSRRTFEALLPQPLRLSEVDRKKSWGIGCSPLGGNGLSESTFGHEAASGALLRIDPVNDLVVIVARDRPGSDDAQDKRFVTRFLHAVASPLEEHRPRE